MGLRDRLQQRQIPTTTFHLRVAFGDDADEARQRWEDAADALEAAKQRGEQDLVPLREKVAEAKAAADPFYEKLLLKALLPADFEELITQHPPTGEQREQARARGGEASWNGDTFVPALLAACVTGEDPEEALSEQDWAWMLTKGPLTSGEKSLLFNTCLEINDRSPDVHVGKD